MRVFGLAVAGILLAQGAQAQDFLRGSVIEPGPVSMNWSGVYGGGALSYSIGSTNFNAQTKPLIADILRNSIVESEMHVSDWPVITNSSGARSPGFGGFIGFNTQWDEIVLGVDVNYMRTNYANDAAGSMTRFQTLSDNNLYDVTVTAASHVEIHDVVTARARAGYVYGTFLPYVTGGVALARASRATTVLVTWPDGAGTPPAPPGFTGTETSGRTNFLAYGYAVGGGIDMALLPNVFARAEYEYTFFSNIGTGLNSGRVGVAVRF
ncbi:MAG TPA: outer membrane beta-barrel protein [Pseudorhodoplanes sp.]|jgi:opacity protein-like surface antigen|nr:outer membrane beta-barrel protein [Pseudorhodoplanes sp.]